MLEDKNPLKNNKEVSNENEGETVSHSVVSNALQPHGL